MSFDQKRNAERLPLDSPIEGTAGGLPVMIVEMSAIGCKIEHREKLTINSSIPLKFTWKDFPVDLKAKVMRMQLRAGMTYESGLKFADSLADAPDIIRAILASIAAADLPADIPPEIAPRIEPPEGLVGAAAAAIAEAEAAQATEAAAAADQQADDFPVPETIEFEDIDFTARSKPKYVECCLVDGKWQRRPVAAVHQPEEGFITLPADEGELDLLCKTYEYADPDTRRLIRISLELTATQKKD